MQHIPGPNYHPALWRCPARHLGRGNLVVHAVLLEVLRPWVQLVGLCGGQLRRRSRDNFRRWGGHTSFERSVNAGFRSPHEHIYTSRRARAVV
eukprot:8100402-Pyramimonas_sp.AAC.1